MDSFVLWVEGTTLHNMMVSSKWLWPAAETIHFIGLAMLLGVIGILDLRMLGMAKSLPLKPLHRLVPWGVAGFVLNAITGIMFFAGAPAGYVSNLSFQLKILLMFLAGINVLLFYMFVFKDVQNLGPEEDAPGPAKVIAGVSVSLWLGVTFFGRMLPFIGQAF